MAKWAPSSESRGLTLMVACTARPSRDGTSVSVTRARAGPSEAIGSPQAITATSTSNAASAARPGAARQPRAPGRAASGRTSEPPTNPPSAPAATAVTRPASAASGSSEAVQGSGIQTWLQPHSAASPIVPIRTPATAPVATGERAPAPAKAASTSTRLDQVEREVRRGLAPDDADHQRDQAADEQEAEHGHQRPAAAEVDAGGDEPDAGGEHDQHGLEHLAELRHAEVELALEGRQGDQEAAREQAAADHDERAPAARAPGRARARRSPRTGAPSRRASPARRRRSASGGSGPRA